MNARPDPVDTARLAALEATGLLDTPPEEGFDRITRLAARLLATPAALVSLVARERQFLKSAVGLPEPWAGRREIPLSHSFCRHVVRAGAPLVIEDARRHPLTRRGPSVRELGWIAYAGVPLASPDGHIIGALAVADTMPRLWSERDLTLLADLAAVANSEIELFQARAARAPPSALPPAPPAAFIHKAEDEKAEDGLPERATAQVLTAESAGSSRLLEQATGAVVRDWDLANDRMTWGEEVMTLFGYEPPAATTANWWYERLHAEDRERVVAGIQAAVARGDQTWAAGYRFRRMDGSYAHVADRGYVVRAADGTPARVVGAMADMTERQLIEQRAAAQVRLAGQVLDALPVGVWVFDEAGSIVLANPASRHIWGGARTGIAGGMGDHRGRWVDSGEPIAPDQWAVPRPARLGQTTLGDLVAIQAFDGTQKTILHSVVQVRAADGQPAGAIVLQYDVTGQRAAEDALRRSEEQLRHAQKMEAVGQLAGGIAHDFNNLLTGILSHCDLILEELRIGDPLRADVEQIRHSGDRAAALTRQLLAFSRRQVLQPSVLSLNAIVTELDAMFRRVLGAHVELETELDPALGHVLADAGQVEQVLVNLVVNARDAMSHGGRVTITTADVPPGGGPAGHVLLAVADTGVGMDAETQARIFEPFFTTKEAGKGTGLGLATVYGIVQQSGGQIAVESEPGQGSTFRIYLPRHAGPDWDLAAAPSERGQLPGGSETVLLVEDEAAVRSSARRLLERHGYTVLEARHGADALRIFEADEMRIDLVLTDLVMPEMGGRELVEHLRSRRPGLKVLYMSGYAERAITDVGTLPPATGFIEKPFSMDELLGRLREILDG